jgi:histidine phosphotransferase ChpT
MNMTYPQMPQMKMPLNDTDPADLTGLIVARLCHDLASPIGAIGNGVELLELSQTASGPELDLVGASVRQASTRLRMFRAAFGAVQDGQVAAVTEVTGLLRGLAETSRAYLENGLRGDMSRQQLKLLILGLMCLETVLPWGGKIHLAQGEDGTGLCLRAEGERMRVDAALWGALPAGPISHLITAATVQFGVLHQQAALQGVTLDVTLADHAVQLDIHPSAVAQT